MATETQATPTSTENNLGTTPVSSHAVPTIVSPVHCPYRQASLLQQALTPDKMRVAFFLGAGCPTAIQVSDGDKTRPLIPATAGLTEQVRMSLEGSEKYKVSFEIIMKRLADNEKGEPNIEEILTHVRQLHEVVGAGKIDGLCKDTLDELDREICRLTTNIVSVHLPLDDTPYHQLATWVGAIQRTHPVEIFTPNYDLLAEQALEKRRVPYFDGFVGSDRAFFDLASMERDNLPARWARLWKVHGSTNWWRTDGGDIERRMDLKDGARQMIHPSHLKYDESRRMPYLAMLDRLRDFLARGQAVLVTCGYSFSDRHLNDVILQGLTGNPTAVCFGLLFGDRTSVPIALADARSHANLKLLAVDGAVLGTVDRDWRSDEKPEEVLHGVAVQSGEIEGRTNAPVERCKFLLGDFKAFGDFLARQLAHRDDIEERNDAK
jgi:hypothetical protein